jgi:hypothetical protein
MPDAENNDLIPNNAITDDVGIGCHHFPHAGSGNHAASMRKIDKAVANLADIFGDPHRSLRIKIVKVIIGACDAVKRWLSPNNAHELCPRRWNSLAFGQFCQPLIDALVGHNFSSRISSLSLSIKARLVSRIRL